MGRGGGEGREGRGEGTSARAWDLKSSLRNDALLTGFINNKNYSNLDNILFRGVSLDCRRLQTRGGGVSKIANICGHPKHTGSFAQNSFHIDSINLSSTSKTKPAILTTNCLNNLFLNQ